MGQSSGWLTCTNVTLLDSREVAGAIVAVVVGVKLGG
jgi:hypothetical protein